MPGYLQTLQCAFPPMRMFFYEAQYNHQNREIHSYPLLPSTSDPIQVSPIVSWSFRTKGTSSSHVAFGCPVFLVIFNLGKLLNFSGTLMHDLGDSEYQRPVIL